MQVEGAPWWGVMLPDLARRDPFQAKGFWASQDKGHSLTLGCSREHSRGLKNSSLRCSSCCRARRNQTRLIPIIFYSLQGIFILN